MKVLILLVVVIFGVAQAQDDWGVPSKSFPGSKGDTQADEQIPSDVKPKKYVIGIHKGDEPSDDQLPEDQLKADPREVAKYRQVEKCKKTMYSTRNRPNVYGCAMKVRSQYGDTRFEECEPCKCSTKNPCSNCKDDMGETMCRNWKNRGNCMPGIGCDKTCDLCGKGGETPGKKQVSKKAPSENCPLYNRGRRGRPTYIQQNVKSWQDCGKICSSRSDCAVFVYMSKKYSNWRRHGNCYIKGTASVNRKVSVKGLISGVKGCQGAGGKRDEPEELYAEEAYDYSSQM